jgi:hypothetical protein
MYDRRLPFWGSDGRGARRKQRKSTERDIHDMRRGDKMRGTQKEKDHQN